MVTFCSKTQDLGTPHFHNTITLGGGGGGVQNIPVLHDHTSNSHESVGFNGEALQLHTVYKKPYFYYTSHKNPYQYCKSCDNPYQYYKSRENPYQVLQVTHAAYERGMKSKVCRIKSLSP